jgi:hypothetical protein
MLVDVVSGAGVVGAWSEVGCFVVWMVIIYIYAFTVVDGGILGVV